MLKEYTSKDVRKHVDVLYKRVDKHFEQQSGGAAGTEEGTALEDVWKACELELGRYREKFEYLTGLCYEGMAVEWTSGDVEDWFRSARRGR